MANLSYKKHSSSWLVKLTYIISSEEIKKIVVDVTKKSNFMGIDCGGRTLLISSTDSWNSVNGVFVSTEQEALDIVQKLSKEIVWKLLRN